MNRLDFEALQAWQTQEQTDLEDDDLDAARTSNVRGNITPEAIVLVLNILLVPTARGAISWRASFRRLAAMAAWITPEVGKDALAAIAAELTRAGMPTTRAALSVINVFLTDKCGFRRTEKTLAAREIYRQSALRFWGKKNR